MILDNIGFAGGKLIVDISNEEFDRGKCTRPHSKEFWESHTSCLKLLGFYYIGEINDIEVDDQKIKPKRSPYIHSIKQVSKRSKKLVDHPNIDDGKDLETIVLL